jgi:hypothetical protein
MPIVALEHISHLTGIIPAVNVTVKKERCKYGYLQWRKQKHH